MGLVPMSPKTTPSAATTRAGRARSPVASEAPNGCPGDTPRPGPVTTLPSARTAARRMTAPLPGDYRPTSTHDGGSVPLGRTFCTHAAAGPQVLKKVIRLHARAGHCLPAVGAGALCGACISGLSTRNSR